MKNSRSSRGFTIVELSAILGVIALGATILTPGFSGVTVNNSASTITTVSGSGIVVAEPETLPVEEILVTITNTATGVTLSRTVAPGDNTATFSGLDPQGNYNVEVAKKSQAGKSAAARVKVEYGQHPTRTAPLSQTRSVLKTHSSSTTTLQDTEEVRTNYSTRTTYAFANSAPESGAFSVVTGSTYDPRYGSPSSLMNFSSRRNSSTVTISCFSPPTGAINVSCSRWSVRRTSTTWDWYAQLSYTPRISANRYTILEIVNPGNSYLRKLTSPECSPGQVRSVEQVQVRRHAGYYTSRIMSGAASTTFEYLLENSGTSWFNGTGAYDTITATTDSSGIYTRNAGYQNITLDRVTCTTPAVYETEEYTIQVPTMQGITTVKEVNAPAGQLVIEVASNPSRSSNWASGTVVAVGAGVSGYTKGETVQFRNGTVFTFDGKQYLRVPARSFLVKK
jgi:hypothetical protein